jgi:N-acetylglucosamine kinase-like BadF-type ATPase
VTALDPTTFVLGVDGGNSKTDVALVAADGRLLAARRIGTISHQQVGLEPGANRLAEAVDAARAEAGIGPDRPPAEQAIYCLAGADTRADVRHLTEAFAARSLARSHHVLNDSFAPVRAGASQGWGVAIICGAGVNAAGIGPDGRTARFAALGNISGDWGGGGDVAMAGLGAAVRARDGRGPRTVLEQRVPAHFEMHRPLDVTNALEHHRLTYEQLRHLSPVIFEAAAEGDPVARAIVERLADELAVMGNAIIRRLGLTRRSVDVVLAGGVFEADDAAFEARIAAGIHDVAPAATVSRLRSLPVAGAALLALDRLWAADPGAESSARLAAAARAETELRAWRPT